MLTVRTLTTTETPTQAIWHGLIEGDVPGYRRPLECVKGDAAYFASPLGVGNQPKWNVGVWVMSGFWSDRFEYLSDKPLTPDDLANLWIACVTATSARSYVDGLTAD